jgi:dihydrofolate reductase
MGKVGEMRPLRYSINVTLDGCCDHRAFSPDEDLHRHAAENLAQADALLFGRVTYEMMEAGWRPPAPTGARPDWMEPFARTINATKKYVVSSTLDESIGTQSSCAGIWGCRSAAQAGAR